MRMLENWKDLEGDLQGVVNRADDHYCINKALCCCTGISIYVVNSQQSLQRFVSLSTRVGCYLKFKPFFFPKKNKIFATLLYLQNVESSMH